MTGESDLQHIWLCCQQALDMTQDALEAASEYADRVHIRDHAAGVRAASLVAAFTQFRDHVRAIQQEGVLPPHGSAKLAKAKGNKKP